MTALDLPQMEGAAPTEQSLESWFTGTYSRFYNMVFHRCMKILHDREMAEERTQDTFLRLWRACLDERYDGANEQGWLLKVATNLCIDELRRGIRGSDAKDPGARFLTWHRMEGEGLGVDTSGEWGESVLHPAFTVPQTPETTYIGAEVYDTVRQALGQLPTSQRKAMALRLVDRTYDEIAATLGTSRAAVKSLLCRARRDVLRPAMWRYLHPPAGQEVQP